MLQESVNFDFSRVKKKVQSSGNSKIEANFELWHTGPSDKFVVGGIFSVSDGVRMKNG